MKIHGVTVSVNYADLLAWGIDRWKNGLDSLTIVTSGADAVTQALARKAGVSTYVTEAFYEEGAVFNKGLALSRLVEDVAFPWVDWVLTFDADILPPDDWRRDVERWVKEPGFLYGATRKLEDGTVYNEGELAGFFQLWHTSDVHVQQRPLYETCWRHAGGYDSEFQSRWGMLRRRLPLTFLHQGEPGQNWWGRGNSEMVGVMQDLRRRGASHDLEILPGQRTRVGTIKPSPPGFGRG